MESLNEVGTSGSDHLLPAVAPSLQASHNIRLPLCEAVLKLVWFPQPAQHSACG